MNQGFQYLLKRVLDSVISIIALIFLATTFALIAMAIKLDSKGPVFFRLERVAMGQGGSMRKNIMPSPFGR